MKTIRIFISSPGDVSQERERASQVIQSLQRRYSRKFLLAPVFWENLPLEPDMSFQQGIDLFLKNPGVDVAVFILWSRLGSPLGASIRKADGSAYRSGTEREYDLMIQARAQSRAKEGVARPRMVIYTRRDDNSFDARLRGKSTAEKKEMLSQKELVESFMKETFKDAETGENIGAYHPFDRPVNFSQRLRTHLQSILDELAGDMDEVIWDVEKQGPPFLGLDAFQPEHADIFFGREEEILEARNALKEKAANGCAFLLLSGASGSGKSSLARAGILPEILAHEPDEHAEIWRSLILTPAELGHNPILGVLNLLSENSLLPELIDQVPSLEKLAADLAKDAPAFFDYAFSKAFLSAETRLGGTARFLLVIDQLEELFTKDALTGKARTAFLVLLEIFARSGRFWIITTVRSDFYEEIQSEPALVRMKEGRGLLDVLPPKPDAITRLIEEPARLAGLTFEKKDGQPLSTRILRDAAHSPQLLPLLEFVLLELFNLDRDTHQLTHTSYEALGGVEGALRRKAESTFTALSPEAQSTLPKILQSLVTLGDESGTGGESDKPVRLRAPLSTFPEVSPAQELITAFTTARLFTTAQTDARSEPTVTVAHESLLRVWLRAVQWKDSNLDFLRTRSRIVTRIKEGSPLLKDDPLLETAKAFLITHVDGFSASQREWVQDSIDRAELKEQQSLKRRRLAFCALSLLTLFSIGAAIWATKSASEAVKQKAEADAGFDAARSSTDDFISRIASEELSYIPGIQDLREEMAKKAIVQYQNLLVRKFSDIRLHLALGQSQLAHADILGQIGTLNEASAAYEEAITQIEKLEKTHRTEQASLLLAKAHINYARFRFNENMNEFLPHAEECSRLLQPFIIDKTNREAGAYAVHAYNLMGNGESDTAKKIAWYEKGREVALGILGKELQKDPVSVGIMRGLAAITWNLSLQMSISEDEAIKSRCQALREESERYYNDLRTAQPDSPIQQRDTAMMLQTQATDLLSAGNKDESRKKYQECVLLWRIAATNNPNVTQFQRGFVLALKDYGIFLSNLGDFAAARASYEEAATVSEKMIGKRADRPANGIALLKVFFQLSEFEHYGKTNKDKGDPKAGAKIREKAISQGRKLVEIYPDSLEMSYELGKIMANHARSEPTKSDPIRVADLYRDAIAMMEKQRLKDPSRLKDWHTGDFLAWSDGLNEILKPKVESDDSALISNQDERIQTLDRALDWMPYVTGFGSKQGLMVVAFHRSEMFIQSNQFTSSIELSLKMIKFCESAYLEKPYHYYLRNSLAMQYLCLAEAYQKTNDPVKEISARQKAIEIRSVPNHGRSVFESVLNPSLAPTIENLTRIRTVYEWGPKYKKFVIPCNVNGVRVPVEFYIHGGTLEKDFDPIADQARWIEEERGVIVPADVRDSLRKLAKVAYENKVDFMELCTYALNYPVDKPNVENPPAGVADDSANKETKSAVTRLPGVAESRSAVDLSWKIFEKERIDLAGKINSLAFAALFEGKYSEAEIAAREALKLATVRYSESVVVGTHDLTPVIYTNLGHALLFQGKYKDALAIYREHWSDPMLGRLFKDGVIEDFDLFDKNNIVHPDLNKMRSALNITPNTPRIKGTSQPMEVPPWFAVSMQAGETERELTEKLRKVIDGEVVERNYDRNLWTEDFIIRMAKAQFLGYKKTYQDGKTTNRIKNGNSK